MSNMNITKTGQFRTDTNSPRFLVNNFTESGNTTGWTLGTHTLTNGILELTGTAPTINSAVFTVNANDIICVEWSFALPTPSSPDGAGKGLYMGTTSGQAVYVHSFNMTTKVWTQSTSTHTNPYFFNAYNKTDAMWRRDYILGTAVDLADVPWGDTSNNPYPPKAIQLSGTQTTIRLRSGYNTNPTMVIDFWNPKVYILSHCGFYESDDLTKASFGQNTAQGFNIYEY